MAGGGADGEKNAGGKSEKRNPGGREGGREIPVVRLDTLARRVDDDEFGLSSTTRSDGEVVGRVGRWRCYKEEGLPTAT